MIYQVPFLSDEKWNCWIYQGSIRSVVQKKSCMPSCSFLDLEMFQASLESFSLKSCYLSRTRQRRRIFSFLCGPRSKSDFSLWYGWCGSLYCSTTSNANLQPLVHRFIRFHFDRPRPSITPFWASTAPEVWLNANPDPDFSFHAVPPDPAFHSYVDSDPASQKMKRIFILNTEGKGIMNNYYLVQCCGSETFISDPVSDPAFSEFRIRIRCRIRFESGSRSWIWILIRNRPKLLFLKQKNKLKK